jgi:integrase
MAHVEDRWYRTVKGPDGRLTKLRTARHGNGLRWRARYLDPDGQERNRSFATKVAAEKFLTEVEHSKIRGSYRDPDAGRITLRRYAEEVFLPAQSSDAVTRERVESALRVHILPGLGGKRLQELEAHPSLVQGWVSGMPLAPSSARRVFSLLSTIMRWAARDKLISTNPCLQGRDGIRLPTVTRRKLEPWTPETVAKMRAELPPRWQAMTDAGTGTGARQSELFALAVGNIDFLRRRVHIRVQIKIVGGRLVFAVPKSKTERSVPLARQTGAALAAHLQLFPAAEVTLPWHEPGTRRHGKPHTAKLLFTTEDGRALNRNGFNRVWRDARKTARLGDDRANGCHMLRHVFASTLVSRGIDPRTVAEYMGHTDGGALVLKTYSHLMPDAEDRARRALEEALGAASEPAIDRPAQDGGEIR